jgi:hypothetical protein
MATVSVGVTPDPLTLTLMETGWPVVDGSGISAVMTFVLLEGGHGDTTIWLALPELPA